MSDASTLFTLLTDKHRRRILFLLCQQESLVIPQDVRTRGQSSWQGNGMQLIGSEQQTEQLEVELHHRHLPKLVDAGVIRWDRETNTVSKGPMFEEVEPALHTLIENAEKFSLDLL